MKFAEGDRVKRADATKDSIPAYRNMRGTVQGFDWTYVLVLWDCDKAAGFAKPSRHHPEDLKRVQVKSGGAK